MPAPAHPPPPLSGTLYNTGLVVYQGNQPGKLVVDAGTLITLAVMDPSGADLNLLLGTGRQLVITREVAAEATRDLSKPGAQPIADWLRANNSAIEQPGSLATVLTGPNAGETSIDNYVAQNGGLADIRVLSDDTRWINGNMNVSVAKQLPAARDLPGTSGQTLTTPEFINDELLSGGISPYQFCKYTYQLQGSGRLTDITQPKMFDPGAPVTLQSENGHTSNLYITPLGAYLGDASAQDAPEQIIGPTGHLSIPQGTDIGVPGLGGSGQPIDFDSGDGSLLRSLGVYSPNVNNTSIFTTTASLSNIEQSVQAAIDKLAPISQNANLASAAQQALQRVTASGQQAVTIATSDFATQIGADVAALQATAQLNASGGAAAQAGGLAGFVNGQSVGQLLSTIGRSLVGGGTAGGTSVGIGSTGPVNGSGGTGSGLNDGGQLGPLTVYKAVYQTQSGATQQVDVSSYAEQGSGLIGPGLTAIDNLLKSLGATEVVALNAVDAATGDTVGSVSNQPNGAISAGGAGTAGVRLPRFDGHR